MPRKPKIDLSRLDGRGPGPGAFTAWALLLVWPLRDVVAGRGPQAPWLPALALAALAALYLGVVRTAFDGRFPLRVPVALLVVHTAFGAVAIPVFDGRWAAAYALLGLAAGVVAGHLPRRTHGPELPMLLCVGGASAAVLASAWLGGASTGAMLGSGYSALTAGAVSAIVIRLFTVVAMLREAREELAEAAVEQERLRFSRDLHDLLGHTLSLMVVKAQAVRLIAERDPAVAAAQAADIETVGRQALTEVRQAVAGYRGRGAGAELDAARTALTDAGVQPVLDRAGGPLPDEADALLGWVVREGVTNVIRHSGARRCEITLRHDAGRAVLEICDDGAGPAPGGPAGNGLRGLAERLDAAGGTVRTGPAPGGGFLLTATLETGQWTT
ncbi:hypothetical protein ACRB68_64640 [Actinomadura sp. RB68]|uniref:Signal transduction histidine kinase subgroup 3 dimerisation and phosphoacceptor domain-containing protein n=1 Tax=Actinomadura macrotermitis TaxID=2585200 RepID=A0A7K0C4I2_9ACTN|nr:hypothetical protein [Actinomadura macrotermitis]